MGLDQFRLDGIGRVVDPSVDVMTGRVFAGFHSLRTNEADQQFPQSSSGSSSHVRPSAQDREEVREVFEPCTEFVALRSVIAPESRSEIGGKRQS
jgi:hypothetical protein